MNQLECPQPLYLGEIEFICRCTILIIPVYFMLSDYELIIKLSNLYLLFS